MQPVAPLTIAAFGDDEDKEDDLIDLVLNIVFLNAFMTPAPRGAFSAVESLPSFEDTLAEEEAASAMPSVEKMDSPSPPMPLILAHHGGPELGSHQAQERNDHRV